MVGPEAALANGIADVFSRHALPLFGPTKAATAIEASKAYAKELMKRAGVLTAAFRAFTELDAAEQYIRDRGGPLVVKASGLAAGKGALVCDTTEQAVAAARSLMRDAIFGSAGQEIVVEERLSGEELSVLAVTDGFDVACLMPAPALPTSTPARPLTAPPLVSSNAPTDSARTTWVASRHAFVCGSSATSPSSLSWPPTVVFTPHHILTKIGCIKPYVRQDHVLHTRDKSEQQ